MLDKRVTEVEEISKSQSNNFAERLEHKDSQNIIYF